MPSAQYRIAEIVARFEERWSPSIPPDAARRAADDFPDLAPDLLRQLVYLDFTCRWEAGVGLPVEPYLNTHFPEFLGDAELKLDLICAELLNVPARPDREHYKARFPDLAAEVERLIQVVEGLGRESLRGVVSSARYSGASSRSQLLTGPPTPVIEPTASPAGPGSQTPATEDLAVAGLCEAGPGSKTPATDRKTVAGLCEAGPGSKTPATDRKTVAGLCEAGPALQLADDYLLGDAVGGGSFKTVCRAVQLSTRRPVAVKLLRQHGAGPADEDTRRFRSEGQTQARLDHQNIPPVFVLGPRPDAPTTLVEKLVPGREWAETIRTAPLRQNLDVLLQVSRALAYAHRQHRVIHRDVKPQNVMLSDYGEVYLVDWGFALHVAERSDPDHPTPHRSLEAHRAAGTPAYMAPELATGNPEVCSPATDVFLLGAILYEILTGTPPYNTGARAALALAAGCAFDPPEKRAPGRDIPRELARVQARAMERDPGDRYRDAGAFADAVERYLRHADAEQQCRRAEQRLAEARQELTALRSAGQPVHPVMTSLIEIADQFRRARADWSEEEQREAAEGEAAARLELAGLALGTGDFALAEAQLDLAAAIPGGAAVEVAELRDRVRSAAAARRRQRLWFRGTASAAAVLLAVSLGAVVYGQIQERQRAEEAERRTRAEAESAAAEAARARESARRIQAEGETALARERQHGAEKLADESRRRAAALPLLEKAALARVQGAHQLAALYGAHALAHTDDPDLRAQWSEDMRQALVPVHITSRRVLLGPLAYRADGKLLASGDVENGAVRVWQVADGVQLLDLRGHHLTDDPTPSVGGVAFHPDDLNRLVSAGADGTVRVWDLAAQREAARSGGAPLAPLRALAIEPGQLPGRAGGRRLLTADLKGGVTWWDLDTLKPVQRVVAHAPRANAVSFRPGGGQCASCGNDGAVRLWDRDGNPAGVLVAPGDQGGKPWIVYDVAYSPDGTSLVAAREDGKLHIWDVGSRKLVRELAGHEAGPTKVRWARAVLWPWPDRIVSGGADGSVRIWDAARGQQVARHAAHGEALNSMHLVSALAAAPEGKGWASAGSDATLWLWEGVDGARRRGLQGGQMAEGSIFPCTAHALDPETNTLVMAGRAYDATLRLLDGSTLQERRTFVQQRLAPDADQPAPATAVALLRGGGRLVTGEASGDLCLWDAATGKKVQTFPAAHRPRQFLQGLPLATLAIDWARDGKRFVTLGQERRVNVWDPERETPLADWDASDPEEVLRAGLPEEARPGPRFVLFSTDGKQVLLGGPENSVRLCEPMTGKVLARLTGHGDRVGAGCLSDDGLVLVTGADDGTVVFWDLERRKLLRAVPVRALLGTVPAGFRPAWPSRQVEALNNRALLPPVVQGLALSPDSRLLAVTMSDTTLAVIDVSNGQLLGRAAGHELAPGLPGSFHPYFLKDQRLLTVGSDGSARHWDLAGWPPGSRRLSRERSARWLACAPDGRQWAAVTAERQLVLWDRRGQEQLAMNSLDAAEFHPLLRPNALAYTPGGQLVVGLYGGHAVVLDPRTGLTAARYQHRELTGKESITAVAVSADGVLAASNWHDDTVDVWRVADGGHVRTLRPPGPRPRGRMCSLAFGGERLAAVHEDGTLHIWEAATGKLLHTGLEGPGQSEATCALAFSPDGRLLVQGGQSRTILVREASSGAVVQELEGHRPQALGDRVLASGTARVAFAPNGSWLASAGHDGTVRLWGVEEGGRYRLVAVLSGSGLGNYRRLEFDENLLPETTLTASLLAVAFSADSKELVAGGWDAPVWRHDLGAVLARLRRPPAEMIAETERITGLRLVDGRAITSQQNRLVLLGDR